MARTIGFLGPLGTYSEEAALLYDKTADRLYPTITGVGEAVAAGEINEGVVPIENSLEGPVTFTLDLLIAQPTLFIRGEIDLPIEHYLLAKSGTVPAEIKVIYSHPQALGQCRQYLEKNYPQAEQMASLSTVLCVTDSFESKVPAAAISPRRASELYDVDILDRGIQDVANNVTRFAVIGLSDHAPTGDDKTSMAFTLEKDSPGLLHRVLGEFADRDINLLKIESRPTKQLLGEYIFVLDCVGHREESPMKEALASLSDPISMLRILGSYPRWKAPI
ncbi:MAG TPA: prephenate dehydratase [Dehalococcoidia bacterium]|nr:prephenate dehydratase [Dehalococcoidia bacterium]HIL30282.1 prephenate dehydratase [Dehalococcoidia bacterium]